MHTVLEDDEIRQTFQTDFRIFARQLDIILPDPAAPPFLGDLKRLGKISVGAKPSETNSWTLLVQERRFEN